MRLPLRLVRAAALTWLGSCGASSAVTPPPLAGTPWISGQTIEAVFGAGTLSSAGSSTASQVSLSGPGALALAPGGALFVVDQLNHRVIREDLAWIKFTGVGADGLLGQALFTGSTRNAGAGGSVPSASGFDNPQGVAMDGTGVLYVSDRGNNRVLRFNGAVAKANGAAADAVLGQADFTTKAFGTTATQFSEPAGVAVEVLGTLWVTDRNNNRVLRFNSAAGKANGAAADGVLGQADFVTATGGTSSTKMRTPHAVIVDASGNLFVADQGNHRVLVFLNAAAKANGAAADLVLGQADFTSGTAPVAASATNMYLPYALAIDNAGRLYVADGGQNRILVFHGAIAKGNGAAADLVLGKPNFTDGSTTMATATNVGQPYGVAVQSSTGKLYISDYSNARVVRLQAAISLVP